MFYRSRDQLTIISVQDGEEKVSFAKIKDLILERMSSVIYCEREGRLHGIITMGDVSKAYRAGRNDVVINTNFTRLFDGEYNRAREIFRARDIINVLPIVNDRGIVIGDYLRWDDITFNKHMSKIRGNEKIIKGSKVVFIRPCAMFPDKLEAYDGYCEWLTQCGAEIIRITCDELLKYVNEAEYFLTVDEAEQRAVETLYGYILHRNDLLGRIVAYNKYFNVVLMRKILQQIAESGICILNLIFADNDNYKRLRRDINKKFADVGEKVSGIMHPSMYKVFFDNLADDDYIDRILHLGYSVINKNGLTMLRDHSGPCYNVSNGERKTVNQPQKYNRTIYFVGPCFMYGHYVEDSNTIESILQEKINDMGFETRVVNYGSLGYSVNFEPMMARILGTDIKQGDIIVIYFHGTIVSDVDNLNLCRILKSDRVSADWMIDVPTHCNHKVNALYAEAIFNKLQPILADKNESQGEHAEYDRDYIKILYINRYFSSFESTRYDNIGSIVMNCNPFTYGHRHLIEQALKIVDFLIIFVVEEDKSIFAFDERFTMVCEGVADLENVLVVPSGPFILSQTTFPEYFIKAADEDLSENVENDITLFAEKIAPRLNIKYRFVGEEPEDVVTNEYNLAMKRILPKNGIELVEIQRKQQEGRCISASAVRKYLEENNMPELRKLVPESTIKVICR